MSEQESVNGNQRTFEVVTYDSDDNLLLLHNEWFSGTADDGSISFSVSQVIGAPSLMLTVTKDGVTKRGTLNLARLTALWTQAFVEDM